MPNEIDKKRVVLTSVCLLLPPKSHIFAFSAVGLSLLFWSLSNNTMDSMTALAIPNTLANNTQPAATPMASTLSSTAMNNQTETPTNQTTIDSSNQYYFKTRWAPESGFNDNPEGVDVDSLGNVYVADTNNH